MTEKQISIFLENKPGQLASICRTLAKSGVNIVALSLADTADFGIVRLIVADHAKGSAALREAGFAVSETEVVALTVPDSPGGMAELMQKLDEAGADIEYSYAYAVAPGQIVAVREKAKSLEVIQASLAGFNHSKYPWIEWDENVMGGKFLHKPERADIPENIKEQMIVELYSK